MFKTIKFIYSLFSCYFEKIFCSFHIFLCEIFLSLKRQNFSVFHKTTRARSGQSSHNFWANRNKNILLSKLTSFFLENRWFPVIPAGNSKTTFRNQNLFFHNSKYNTFFSICQEENLSKCLFFPNLKIYKRVINIG